jgi:hypothetical protein
VGGGFRGRVGVRVDVRELAEALEEGIDVVELASVEEAQDGPQLGDVVLEGRAGEHELTLRTQSGHDLVRLGLAQD